MISKKIHYCWFGENKKPDTIVKYIDKWKQIYTDYQVVEWNESNFDVNSVRFVQEAYSKKKYAFVSDYVRIFALYHFGGIYFDTDVEVLRNAEELFQSNKIVLGFESKELVLSAFLATEKENETIYKILKKYDNMNFINPDGSINNTPNTVMITKVFEELGLIKNGLKQTFGSSITIYPVDVFSAFDLASQRINKTENTFQIHHCDGSWQSLRDKVKPKVKMILIRLFGEKIFNKVKLLLTNRE